MLIFPAIDLLGGQAVRLVRGDYNQKTVYSPDPLAVAQRFAAAGARQLHVVDLEGAKSGKTENLAVIAAIARQTDLFLQVGGGIRSLDTVERYCSLGVNRVILGTAAVQDEAFLRQALSAFGPRVAVGVDLRDGRVAVEGWTQTTDWTCDDFCAHLQALGVQTLVCTDIARDGLLRGANHALYRRLQGQYRMQLIASGGVSTLQDVKELRAAGLYGAIVGKATYTGALDLRQAIEVAT